MISETQCELARVMTGTKTDSIQINAEFSILNDEYKLSAAKKIDILCKEHNGAFDKVFALMKDDFSVVADQFDISPATLFCVYMDAKSKHNI